MADRTVRPPWLVGAALWDALAAAAIAAVLALPLLGFRLADSPQGLSLDYRLSWVAYAAMTVFLGRLLLSFGATALKRCPLVDVLPVFRFGWISARIASWVLVLFALVGTHTLNVRQSSLPIMPVGLAVKMSQPSAAQEVLGTAGWMQKSPRTVPLCMPVLNCGSG